LNHGIAVRIPGYLAQGFQHGVVRFFSAEAFYALSASSPQRVVSDSLLVKRIHQCRFADSGFARDENDLPLASERITETAVQFAQRSFAAHHRLPCV
jgi:hypothetical protein